MAIEVFNRREIKYFITDEQYKKLLPVLNQHMNSDPYNKNGKTYPICNLYLDTEKDELIRKSLDKPLYKEKLRLRSYGNIPLEGNCFLEIKKKFKGLVNKRRTPFILSEAYDFIDSEKLPEKSATNWQVLREIQYMLEHYKVLPKVYIAYQRFAFFEKDNNDFRMTLDTEITTRRTDVRLESGNYGTQLLPPGVWLMEAKAFKAFPLWFVNFLSENKIFSTSFSKYGSEYTNYIKTNPKIYSI